MRLEDLGFPNRHAWFHACHLLRGHFDIQHCHDSKGATHLVTRTLFPMAFLTFPALGTVAMADDGTSLSDAQTSYTGASMLIGDEDVVFPVAASVVQPMLKT